MHRVGPGAGFPKDNASSTAECCLLLRVLTARNYPPYAAAGEAAAPRVRCTENYKVRACPTTPGGWHAISSDVDGYNNNNIIISPWPITVVTAAAAAAAVAGVVL